MEFRETPDLRLVGYYRNSQAGGDTEGQGGMALPCPHQARHSPPPARQRVRQVGALEPAVGRFVEVL